jgi:methylthioribose-1-phosphate isomerase
LSRNWKNIGTPEKVSIIQEIRLVYLDSMALRFRCDFSNEYSNEYSNGSNQAELWILDQTLLPQVEQWLCLSSVEECIAALKALKVRGAPLIGVVAALSLAQSAISGTKSEQLSGELEALECARPTAVNLMAAMARMRKIILSGATRELMLATAVEIFNEDVKLCERMACHGADLIETGDSILTHCNTGGLATVGCGTALGVIKKAVQQGKSLHVYVDETRPLLQGARLTTWELQRLGIPFTLITDSMAGQLMSLGKITKAIVGCDRIAANGDFANKIGTYSVAVLCHYHELPFYVAGPSTTLDLSCATGALIPIEQRQEGEITGVAGHFGAVTWAPPRIQVYNPSFDVTPAKLVTRWILDSGVYQREDFTNGRVKQCLQ